jgi:hypothetical protein
MHHSDLSPCGIRVRPKQRHVPLPLAGIIVLLILVAAAGIHCVQHGLSAKGLSGVLLNVVAVPTPGGGCRLWILADGSATYIKSVSRPGYRSMARKCVSCKTWLYVYDPVQGTVLTKFRADYKTVITKTWMACANGKIWVASAPYAENEPRLFLYATEPAGLIDETPGIVARYHELASGIIGLRMGKDPDRLTLDTKDGHTGLVLTLGDGMLYPSLTEYSNATARRDQERITIFALGREDSGPRKRLYKVTGPRERISGDFIEYGLKNPDSLRSMSNATAEPATPDRVYIEGMIFYQDADGCLIVDQDTAGPIADRRLTCVDAAGKEKWTIPQAGLFKEMRVDTNKRSLSGIFFMKDNIDVSRAGKVILFQLKGVGFIGFDFETGEKLWEVRS